MRSIPAAFVAAVLAGSAACTQSPTPTPGLASSPAAVTAQDGRPTFALTGTPSATRCGWDNDSGTDVPTYRGMTVVAAKARAISEGLKVRDRGADGECFLTESDYQPSGRINFYSERGVVVWAQLY